ncbi:MAG: YesL family protein [Ruminiclostridium sp.]|nr:YesL family protein [Ruminiclostridium sp.]
MAGIFGMFDYTKEGPGIPKDAPPKSRFVIFFEVLGRKFWKIIRVNLMFGVFNIPAFLFLLIFAASYSHLFIPPEIPETDQLRYLLGGTVPLLSVFLCLPMITVGPAQAGMTYILRNFSREEHAFLWSDFIEHAKKNFKQSMIVGTINLFITVLVIVLINFYFRLPGSLLITAASTILIVIFVMFMMMSMYIYPMMVTFNLTIRQLYKNALSFAIMKLIPNLLILILCSALVIVSFYFNPVIGYILFIFITMALISFITNFYVYPKLDKYMIQPTLQKKEEEQVPVQDSL